MGAVYTRFYDGNALPFDRKEALRYYGIRAGGALPSGMDALFGACVQEALAACTYKVCYAEFCVSQRDERIDLGFTQTDSRALRRNLEGCEKVVAFAATVGMGLDRLIARYTSLSPVRGYAFQAIGAERIEALCDAFNGEIEREYAAKGLYARPRFSCGYGDFPLQAQKDFFRALDCTRKIGVTLNDSLLLSPSKSVTAVIGLSPAPREGKDVLNGQAGDKGAEETGHVRSECDNCSAAECVFRRGES